MRKIFLVAFGVLLLLAFTNEKRVPRIYMVGDSTVMDYENHYDDYMSEAYPLTGWGQSFKAYMNTDSLSALQALLGTDTAVLENRAMGGRGTRSFFQEGRWRKIYDSIQSGDIVIIQMGHNDATPAELRPNRAVTPAAYQEFLRMYVSMTRDKGATPILVTPMNQDNWNEDGTIKQSHGDYYPAMLAVAEEMNVQLFDLTKASMALFEEKGQEYVSSHYFMNLPAGKYKAKPKGLEDHTHFQTEGAAVLAQLVYNGLKEMKAEQH